MLGQEQAWNAEEVCAFAEALVLGGAAGTAQEGLALALSGLEAVRPRLQQPTQIKIGRDTSCSRTMVFGVAGLLNISREATTVDGAVDAAVKLLGPQESTTFPVDADRVASVGFGTFSVRKGS